MQIKTNKLARKQDDAVGWAFDANVTAADSLAPEAVTEKLAQLQAAARELGLNLTLGRDWQFDEPPALPRHAHDCDRCTFLGHHGNDDLYFCEKQLGGPTVIARWSSNGPDYASGLQFAKNFLKNEKECVLPNGVTTEWADYTRSLGMALRLAIVAGLYRDTDFLVPPPTHKGESTRC